MKKWSTKFELKPNRWVFVPTPECAALGREIKQRIADRWRVPEFYFHLRQGGHLAAVGAHSGHAHLARLDIEDFFGSIGLSRVTRSLKDHFGYELAREWAKASTVRHPGTGNHILPFGFVQSQIIASLCLHDSALGRELRRLSRNPDLAVSVYVDDLIVSSQSEEACKFAVDGIEAAAKKANFNLSAGKKQGPASAISAFNIDVSGSDLAITSNRMDHFAAAVLNGKPATRDAIFAYVSLVNSAQADALRNIKAPLQVLPGS